MVLDPKKKCRRVPDQDRDANWTEVPKRMVWERGPDRGVRALKRYRKKGSNQSLGIGERGVKRRSVHKCEGRVGDPLS